MIDDPPLNETSVECTVEYDWMAEHSPSMEIVTAVSNCDGTHPTELPPIHEVVDVDALNALFRPRLDGTPRINGHIHIRYSGYDVTFYSNGEIYITRPRYLED